jgi:hypothetical protein
MTIFASHFSVVLGAWRLRVRIDLDEPRESELRAADAPAAHQPGSSVNGAEAAAWHPDWPPPPWLRGQGRHQAP